MVNKTVFFIEVLSSFIHLSGQQLILGQKCELVCTLSYSVVLDKKFNKS